MFNNQFYGNQEVKNNFTPVSNHLNQREDMDHNDYEHLKSDPNLNKDYFKDNMEGFYQLKQLEDNNEKLKNILSEYDSMQNQNKQGNLQPEAQKYQPYMNQNINKNVNYGNIKINKYLEQDNYIKPKQEDKFENVKGIIYLEITLINHLPTIIRFKKKTTVRIQNLLRQSNKRKKRKKSQRKARKRRCKGY